MKKFEEMDYTERKEISELRNIEAIYIDEE
jgi:hypothetical protein